MPSSLFTKSTAAEVWKGVVGVSAAGKKRGRGRGINRSLVKDLNKEQKIGVGRVRLVLPGLNTQIRSDISGGFQRIEDLGPNEEFKKNSNVFSNFSLRRKNIENPLDRGWSGRKAPGREAGPPDPFNDTEFEGFHSTVLKLRNIQIMTGNFGRTRFTQGLVVTGNGNGIAGFADANGKDARAVVRHARNRAAQSLISIPRWENHTVMHDFFSRYYSSTVFVERKPKGHGIRAHRIIEAICRAFGITDLYAKVEGSEGNAINITKAFFLGLMNQKSYEDMAEEKKLHLVDLREENFYFPRVLASPVSGLRDDDDIKRSSENLDFTYYINNGKIKQVKPKKRSPFENHPMWFRHLDRMDYGKNREKTKLLLAAKYGDKNIVDIFPRFKSNADSFNKPKIE